MGGFRVFPEFIFYKSPQFYFIGALIVLLTLAISVVSPIFLIFRNSELKTESHKFKIIRGADPKLASEIDGLYLKDKSKHIQNSELKIQQHQMLMELSLREIRQKKAYQKARLLEKSLKDKQKKAKYIVTR